MFDYLLDKLKAFMGITDTTSDAELLAALNTAGALCEVYIDRVIAKREVTEQFAHHFGTVLLHNAPVAPDTVRVYLNGAEQSDYSTYVQRSGAVYVTRIGNVWDVPLDWRGFDQADVVYTAGWDEPLPTSIELAIMYTASSLFQAEGTGASAGSGGVKVLQLYDVASVTYDTGGNSGGYATNDQGILSTTSISLLAPYKRMAA